MKRVTQCTLTNTILHKCFQVSTKKTKNCMHHIKISTRQWQAKTFTDITGFTVLDKAAKNYIPSRDYEITEKEGKGKW